MPSGHSSSSHSSSSHSSSSHSFSSSSSRSSYSSRSSSSSSSSGRSSYSRGPSGHSSTSHSSSFFSGSNSRPSRPSAPVRPSTPMRPRVNQPSGYRPTGGRPPAYYYGHRHDYVFYPVAWVDSSTGTSYESGYYDENGRRYDNVAVAKDGKYDNVVCHCPYCGQDTVMSLDAETAATQSLQCPSCGGPMEIKSALDDYMAGGEAAGDGPTVSAPITNRKSNKLGCLVAIAITLLVLVVLFMIGSVQDSHEPSGYTQSTSTQQTSYVDPNVELFGETIFLRNVEGNAFEISDDASSAGKILTWSEDDESYYDIQDDCYLWYNVELEPANWQYWYEGISSDYGDYGWMEHDLNGWFIEESRGNWIKLPDKYDADALWYIVE